MKKNKKLYYYEYDENKEILKVTEGVYQETKNKLLILDNIYIPKSISLLDVTQKIKKEITLGRIYLWKKEN